MSEQVRPRLRCPLCQSDRFDNEDGRLSMRSGGTDQRVALLICRRCKHILPFFNRQSYFDTGSA